MTQDFFYSKSTGLYIARKPLVIDARVKKAAAVARISLDWNDEGVINNIDFDDAKRLLQSLGAKLLTPIEYWKVYSDAINTNDSGMIKELESDRYAEWLDRVYTSEREFIDSPEIVGRHRYLGEPRLAKCPHGRPGWFNPKDNISDTGEPLNIKGTREKFATSWKYWSPDLSVTSLGACAPIRGYVTSVGKPSLDLGIPVDSRQPRLMVRECRREPLSPAIDPLILALAERSSGQQLVDFIAKHGSLFSTSKDSLIYKMRERFFNQLGEIALDRDILQAASRLWNISTGLSYDDFASFIRSSRERLESSLANDRDLVFVMGHKNPDTDTAISCLFEAYRNHLLDSATVYIPVIQGERMPDEIVVLLGNLSEYVLLSSGEPYKRAKAGGLARWISVDQNREPEVQKYFISIIDHHIVSESAKNRDIPKTLEMVGSTAALITRKYLGMGLHIDQEMARLLYGATLMDTENRVEHKMTPIDARLMDYLKARSGVQDDALFYSQLMSCLLNTDDANILFGRDYKEDWGFGFAVAKIKNGFSGSGKEIKASLLSRLHQLAAQNNLDKNLPLTLLKVTDYKDDNETVNRERVYAVFNTGASQQYRDAVRGVLESIIQFEFPGQTVKRGDDYVEFSGGGMQLSRKKTAPVLEPVSAAFNRYFYSHSIARWVKRDFLKKTGIIQGQYSTDELGRINYITYEEAKELAGAQGFGILSLGEFWKVLNDAKRANDLQMVGSLQGSNFVEFLDTRIVNKKFIIDHDQERGEANIPAGNPGLIHPGEINPDTGLPARVRPPNEYGNPELWRYWQPDADLVIPCRSYIFLLDQPCLDGKFHPGESFPNLGIRPVVTRVTYPKIETAWDDEHLTVRIFEEGDANTWKWPKRIWDY